MARTFTPETASPYYPPRARWYGGIFYLAGAVRRGTAMDRISLPREVTWRGLIGSFFVPGLAVWLRGPRIWGRAAMATSGLLFSVFILWLGYPVANLAFGLMISLHASGFVYYCSPAAGRWQFRWRTAFTVLVLMAIGLLLYSPLRSAIQNHLLMPVRLNGQVLVVERRTTARGIHRGDLVAYRLTGYYFSNHGGQGVSGRSGIGLGSVLALPGDRVAFAKNFFAVNGVKHLALPHMPTTGGLVVLENHWFIWPNLGISGNWNVGEQNISAAMIQLANVSEEQFMGKALERWLWREQILQ